MPTNISPKQISLLQMTVPGPEALPEDLETKLRFQRFALADKSYIKALKRLLDLANAA